MPLKIVRVDKEELQRLFNEAKYADRVQTGEWLEVVLNESVPSPSSGQATGTISQRVAYVQSWDGRQMAVVHQFHNRNWTLGASGQPDPVRMVSGDILYVLRTENLR